ncbi:hypothetical protein LGV61_12565 [Desulfurispirillum indicum]|uniref:Wzz/FepE/Etk N-terminal domain-containing protein n=1 Tax=Desulfurispirillum indicum TaxID=936456 RepID=UPI001CF9ADD9|nr:Wzz/FepE/Etk N-terminal domain-containing protein [Desulfurispirillum indicum]UCZ56545.1 hypothetical protein LGV61_12565 [Desulfurispirillum indicum]
MQEQTPPARYAYTDDEIDLRDLVRTILSWKWVIIGVTLLATVLGVAYALVKTPVYQARAVLEIGFYTDGNERKLVDSAQRLNRELETVFISIPRAQDIERDAWIDSVTTVRGDNNFIELSALGISRDLARSEVARVVDYVRTEHQEIIEALLENKQSELRTLDRRIDDLQGRRLQSFDQRTEQELDALDREIAHIEDRRLKALDERLEFAQNIDRPRIDQRIARFREEVAQYERQLGHAISNAQTTKEQDAALSALTLMEIRNLEEKLTDRRLRLIDEQRRLDELQRTTIPDLQREREKLVDIDLRNLKEKRDMVRDESQRERQKIVEMDLQSLLDQRTLLAATIAPHNYSNTRMVGDIISRDTPVAPKKRLIVMVAFVAGFMGSLFLVFILEFAKSFRNGKTQTDGG